MRVAGEELDLANVVGTGDDLGIVGFGEERVEKVAVKAMEVVETVEVFADLALGAEVLEFADGTF